MLKTPRARHAAAVLRDACRDWLRCEELSIALVSDREMRALNRRWRDKDTTTDVLSFPLGGGAGFARDGRRPQAGALVGGAGFARDGRRPQAGALVGGGGFARDGRRPQAGALVAGREPLGDVVISLPTARRQAREGGWPLSVELRRLLAHGLLHCRGYDHETAKDARRMALAERRLLGARGMVGDSLSQKSVPTARDSR